MTTAWEQSESVGKRGNEKKRRKREKRGGTQRCVLLHIGGVIVVVVGEGGGRRRRDGACPSFRLSVPLRPPYRTVAVVSVSTFHLFHRSLNACCCCSTPTNTPPLPNPNGQFVGSLTPRLHLQQSQKSFQALLHVQWTKRQLELIVSNNLQEHHHHFDAGPCVFLLSVSRRVIGVCVRYCLVLCFATAVRENALVVSDWSSSFSPFQSKAHKQHYSDKQDASWRFSTVWLFVFLFLCWF